MLLKSDLDVQQIYLWVSLLNKSSHLAPALGVAKVIIVTDMMWSNFAVILKSDLDIQQTHVWVILLNKSLCLAPALGVTKFIIVIVRIWVTLCCAT